MNENKLAKLLFAIVIVCAVILTIINLKLLDILFIINGCERISNNIAIVFSIFVLSYSIVLYIIPFLENILEYIFIKTNETNTQHLEMKYYRELIEKYSIGTLVKCYGKKVDSKDQLVSTLLRLIMIKKIKLDHEKIEIIDEEGLSPSEFMFVKSCKECCVYTKRNLKKQIETDNTNDAIQTELFCKNGANTTNIEKDPLMLGIILWILNFFTIILSVLMYKTDMWIILVIPFISHFLVILSLSIYQHKIFIYKTEQGIEIQRKLMRIKKFSKRL